MTRARVAAVLGTVAVLCVAATAAVATRDRSEPEATVTVTGGGATFEVPADGWRVEDRRVRIFYADEKGRPVAVVRGPAVFRAGYCGKGSNQAFAGFTRQPLEAWAGALGTAGAIEREAVQIADGTVANLLRVEVDVDARGECAVPEVQVSMIEVGDVRVVLVRDAGALPDDDLLLSLELS